MAVRLIITWKALPGRASELAEAFLPVMQVVRREDGCEQYHLFQSTEDPDGLVLLERWRDEESLAKHAEGMRSRPTTHRELMAEPSVMETFHSE